MTFGALTMLCNHHHDLVPYGFSLYTDLGKITYVPVFIQLLYHVNLCLSAKVF